MSLAPPPPATSGPSWIRWLQQLWESIRALEAAGGGGGASTEVFAEAWTTAGTAPTASAWKVVPWDNLRTETHSGSFTTSATWTDAGSGAKFTVPTGQAGKYELLWAVGFSGSSAFYSWVSVNGVTPGAVAVGEGYRMAMEPASGLALTGGARSIILTLAEGDYFQTMINHPAGSSLHASSYSNWIQIRKLN